MPATKLIVFGTSTDYRRCICKETNESSRYFMSSRRSQLKQQIARTKDPVIRMQLQELLNRKRQQRNTGIRKIEEIFDSASRQAINKLSSSALRVLMLVVITIILFIIFLVLESRV